MRLRTADGSRVEPRYRCSTNVSAVAGTVPTRLGVDGCTGWPVRDADISDTRPPIPILQQFNANLILGSA